METFIYPTWKTVFFSFTRNTPTAAGEEAHTNSSLYHVEHILWFPGNSFGVSKE